MADALSLFDLTFFLTAIVQNFSEIRFQPEIIVLSQKWMGSASGSEGTQLKDNIVSISASELTARADYVYITNEIEIRGRGLTFQNEF